MSAKDPAREAWEYAKQLLALGVKAAGDAPGGAEQLDATFAMIAADFPDLAQRLTVYQGVTSAISVVVGGWMQASAASRGCSAEDLWSEIALALAAADPFPRSEEQR